MTTKNACADDLGRVTAGAFAEGAEAVVATPSKASCTVCQYPGVAQLEYATSKEREAAAKAADEAKAAEAAEAPPAA